MNVYFSKNTFFVALFLPSFYLIRWYTVCWNKGGTMVCRLTVFQGENWGFLSTYLPYSTPFSLQCFCHLSLMRSTRIRKFESKLMGRKKQRRKRLEVCTKIRRLVWLVMRKYSPYLSLNCMNVVWLHKKCEKEIRTESIRKLGNFNFHWTKTLYQNNLNNNAFFFTFFKGYSYN